MTPPVFPNVRCKNHVDAPGYAVCVHVVEEGALVWEHELPSPKNLGSMLCYHCALDPAGPQLGDLVLACAQCAAPFLKQGAS